LAGRSVDCVTTFLAECYWSASSQPDELATLIRRSVEVVVRQGVDVRYVRSILVPGDETCFHVFEAASAEAVDAVGRLAALPLVRVVEVLEP
jgi:Nickel responsive protein SCO4226-like